MTAQNEVQTGWDKEKLGVMFDKHAPGLYKYLRRLGVGETEADQGVGEVFSKTIDQIAEGGGPNKNVRAYFFQSAYNWRVDQAREGKRLADLQATEQTIDINARYPEDSLVEMEELELLAQAMDTLTDEQRNVTVLRFMEDFSLKETAEIMSKNVNAIKQLQRRALEKLRVTISKDEWDKLVIA
jgi:RNA polymerase sigma-70 factor (ECF subfamily)